PPTALTPLSLHDALPIFPSTAASVHGRAPSVVAEARSDQGTTKGDPRQRAEPRALPPRLPLPPALSRDDRQVPQRPRAARSGTGDRKSTRLNSSHDQISY